jgi:hypothetical protein
VKLPWPRCSPRAAVLATLSKRTSTSLQEHTEKSDLARPSPDVAQKGPDLGQDSATAGLYAALPPSGRAIATTSTGAAATREERSRQRNHVH